MFILFAAGIASADVSTEDRWVGNDNIEIGVHQDGSFVNEDIELGILWDPDGTEGPMPLMGDMLRVGYHWDILVWRWESASGDDGGRVQGGPQTDAWAEVDWLSKTNNEAIMGLHGELTDGPLQIEFRIAALQHTDVVIYDLVISSDEELSQLAVGRAFDPDQDNWFYGSSSSPHYDTVNDSDENWAYGASAYDERAIGLAGITKESDLVTGGVCTGWCESPSTMLEAAGESSDGDGHPNVVVRIEEPDPDKAIHIRFVYAFAVGGEAAATTAQEMLALDDLDGDGISAEDGDCDDWDPNTYPGAPEEADDVDNDCDGEVYEESLTTDNDGDGYSEADGDCDDEDPSVFPGAEPTDGVSNADCDGIADNPEEEGGDPGDESEEEEDTGSVEDNTEDDDPPDETDETGEEPGSFDIEDGGTVIAGTKQDCSCATASGSVQWSWLLALLAWGRRRKENP